MGWSASTREPDVLARAIRGASFVVTARAANGGLARLARAVSDDASICFVQDILVDPAFQKSGAGRELLNAVQKRYRHVRQLVLITDKEPGQVEPADVAHSSLRARICSPVDRGFHGGYVLSMRRPWRAAILGLVVCGLASGCSLLAPAASETCVDWIRFETPQAQFDHAALVLIGKPVRVDGETLIYGYKANIYLLEVETVLKGDPGPAPLRIASTPPTCSAGVSYPDGDPLERSQRMLIFANKQEGGWFTQTPAQGAIPFEVGEPLPFGAAAP